MTLLDAQDYLALRLDETETPDVDSDDWNTRTKAINAGVRIWAGTYGVDWRELFRISSDIAVTGTALTIALDIDGFKRPLGYVQILKDDGTIKSYDVIKPSAAQTAVFNGKTQAYFTGSASSREIVFTGLPAAGTLLLPFLKEPAQLVAEDDVFEMSEPDFAVLYAHAQLVRADDPDGYTSAMAEAQGLLDTMVANNESAPPANWDTIPDLIGGFGLL